MFLMCAILNMFVISLKIFSRYLIFIEAISLFQYIIVLRFLAYFPIYPMLDE